MISDDLTHDYNAVNKLQECVSQHLAETRGLPHFTSSQMDAVVGTRAKDQS